ncbi:microsomal glutathione S-transferase 1-like [Gigantopelta aegis]|uniref:microsomal glutathione S-transferase 1-like n=1 Tax=Gigantopelta aegis TaxID=1735272 RepID=UPI001B88ADF6|nr:microsomal glutathione S-transferase 1-like [Gigantopelta aegis]
MAGQLSFDNPIFSKFAFYSTLVVGKTMMMSHLTTINRIRKEAYANEEDTKTFGKTPGLLVKLADSTVERIRRCHLNDLENVFPFVLVGLFYVSSGPDSTIATWHFKIFAGARILHTLAYLFSLPQPCRFLCHNVCWFVTASMAARVLARALDIEFYI